jgi:hypothetical protein
VSKLLFEYGRTGGDSKRIVELPLVFNISPASPQLVHFTVLLPHMRLPTEILPTDPGWYIEVVLTTTDEPRAHSDYCLLVFEVQNNSVLPFTTTCQVIESGIGLISIHLTELNRQAT